MGKKHKQNRVTKVFHNGHGPIVDRMAYLGIISPVMAIPQAYIVWNGKATGVSFITWLTFLAISIMWLFYGLKHKLKPIIIIQWVWIAVNASIVAGLLLKRY